VLKKRLVSVLWVLILNSAVVHAEGIPTFDAKAALNHALIIENQARSLINEANQLQSVSGLRDFAGRVNKDLEQVPEEWSSIMGDIAKSNAETELKKVSANIRVDSFQKTYLAYAQVYMAEAQKSVKNWEQLSKLQEAANSAEDLKASQDIANRIQIQLQTDRLTEKRLATLKEISEMQQRIYAMNAGKKNLCYSKARTNRSTYEVESKKCKLMP